MNNVRADWLSRNELRLWMYACPFVSFGIANSYTYAGAFHDLNYSNFMNFYLPVANVLLPLILPLKNQDNLKWIAISLAVQSPILTLFRERAQFDMSMHDFPITSIMILTTVLFQVALICLPIAIKAAILETKAKIKRKKSPSTYNAEGFLDSDP